MLWYNECRADESELQNLTKNDYDQTNMNSIDVNLRFLTADDITEIQTLCLDFFPIEYPYTWYEDITSNTARFFSLAACNKFGRIIGLIVSEIKPMNKLNKEDRKIISESSSNYSLAYILSLGVHKNYRRNGIASLLLRTLVDHLSEFEKKANLKAVYLHVLTTNRAAIMFYEKNDFVLHSFLPYYYSIKGTAKDAFLYIKFLNGGRVAPTLIQTISENFARVFNFNIFRWIANRFRFLINWMNFHTFSKMHLIRQ